MKKLSVAGALCLLACVAAIVSCSHRISDPAEPVGVKGNEPVAVAKPPSTYGNCLSMPVIFAEGHGLTGDLLTNATGLRGTPGVESFIDPYDDVTLIDGFPVYRNPSINEWQADWADGSISGGLVPVELDWADNLTRQTWNERSKVRVEVVLTTPSDVFDLQGYSMFSLGGTQLNEVFVTNTVKYQAALATVYSSVARLTIERLDAKGGVPILTVYDSPCYEGYFVDGPTDAFSAEVNMSGKCIYGFNWDVTDVPLTNKSGWYRLTFGLDAAATYQGLEGAVHSYARNTIIDHLNPADLLGYVTPEVVLYPPTLAINGFASVLEVYIGTKGTGRTKT